MKNILILFILISCSGLRTKDFNKVDIGMSKRQVTDILGEPNESKTVNGAQVLIYSPKDDEGDERLRWVVLQDKEVVFYGKPQDYKEQAEMEPAQSNINNNVTPVFNNNNVIHNHGSEQPTPSKVLPKEINGKETGAEESKVSFYPL